MALFRGCICILVEYVRGSSTNFGSDIICYLLTGQISVEEVYYCVLVVPGRIDDRSYDNVPVFFCLFFFCAFVMIVYYLSTDAIGKNADKLIAHLPSAP